MAWVMLVPRGPFSLELLAGFGYGPETGAPEATEPVLRIAFCLDNMRGHARYLMTVRC